MAGKKVKYRCKPKKIDIIKLKPSDIICPICRTVLIEPVSLPCNHVFCKFCFDSTMENANLVCPLCRIRVGSWYRRTKKEVENKYKGIDNVIEQDKPTIIVSKPGEIRKEYETEKQKQEEELKKLHEEEEKASAALIKQLKQEEEYINQLEQEKIRLDEEFARKISNELMPSTSKLTKDLDKKRLGPLDKFLQNKNSKVFKLPQNSEDFTDDSKNVLTGQNACKTLTPNNLSTKPYTCQVLYIDNNSTNKVSYLEGTTVLNSKIKKKNQNSDINERKNLCQSECGSSGSRENSDVIDQECKFYFKPIDLYKKYHIQGHLPLKIPCRKDLPLETNRIVPPGGIVVNLVSKIQKSAFAKLSTVIQEENEETSVKASSACLSRKRKYEEFNDFHSNNDNFHGFKATDISKSLKSCDNLVTVLLKSNDVFFKRKFIEIAECKKKYTQECGYNDINQQTLFNENPNIVEKHIINSNIDAYHLSETDISPKSNKNSGQKALVDSPIYVDTNNQQNNLFRSSNHKILIYDDKYNQDTSTLCTLSAIKVKNFYNSNIKNISTSKKPNKFTQISQNQTVDPSVNKKNIQTHMNLNSTINITKRVKNSPKKIKLNTNLTRNIEAIEFRNIHALNEKKLQEESDFELAKKLQAEFDLIHIPSRTRRGTTRQVTLDKMLLV
ncbi:hypothetical protein GWI33_005975 [Rhynchophorus ferrugineus]|uniref:RING-type E3 ubiquitin transferase n=1 Tax=Rhynchophorus ferrugineus TaxID=354439 RepID=A0A834MKS8_RHYFE|nr:hypothetical protein GWI33_005975 [Rhynchophorus ferrugineus]